MPPPPRNQFYQVVSEAINDLIEHGFDSQERLDEWMRRLETAARALLVPRHVLENALRDGLQRVFARTTTTANLLKVHRGISQFTLEMVKPKLRAELDRRILAGASLIKLNREASVQRTLQRFAGWATSIPIGGTELADRADVKATVRRGIAALPFEERRVVIDQGHKLSSAINEIVATDGGAIAAKWRHTMEGGGYQARPVHEKRNNEIFLIRDSWAVKDELVRLASHQYTDQVEQPGQLVFCRCNWVFIYALRDLPPEMLSSKGRDELARVRQQIARMN
jgi:hypothetical protein